MNHRRTLVSISAAGVLAAGTPTLAAAGPPPEATSAIGGVTTLHRGDDLKHQHTVATESIRGLTFVCGNLTLRVTRGELTETTDADMRNGVTRISISRIGPEARLRGSDGRTYRASGATVAWFVLQAPDFDTPLHGLEVTQIMFRGGPDKSPGWLRERIKWTDKQESESVHGPCDFAD